MIPHRLSLTNFLSYGETAVLDLRGVHLACIAGPNGAGKSSLLDALTWALFGQSRSKSDDDVVNRLGAAKGEMAEVRLIFELNNTLYRIIRRKKVRRSSDLEFQLGEGDVAALDDVNWRTLSEGKIRETQAAIEQTLNMSYDIFVNASFLLQGKADEFTTRTPKGRKEILADLIGASRWGVVVEAARLQRREVERQLERLDGRLEDVVNELAEEETRRAHLAATETQADTLRAQLDAQEKLLHQTRRLNEAKRRQEKEVERVTAALAEVASKVTAVTRSLEARRTERAGHQALLDEADAIHTQHAAWLAADADFQAWQAKAEAASRWQQARQPHEVAVAEARSRLHAQRRQLTARAAEITALAEERTKVAEQLITAEATEATAVAALTALADEESAYHETAQALEAHRLERRHREDERRRLEQEAATAEQWRAEREKAAANRAEAEAALQRLDVRVAAQAERQERLEQLQQETAGMEGELKGLKAGMQRLRAQIDALESAASDACPVCGQALTDAHRQQAIADLESQGQEQKKRYQDIKARLPEKSKTIARLQAESRSERDLAAVQQQQQKRRADADAHEQALVARLAQWEAEGAGRLATVTAALATDGAAALEARLAQLQTAVAARSAREAERRRAADAAATARARLAEINRATAHWEQQGAPDLAAVEKELTTESFAPEARAALVQLDEKLADVGYDPVRHDTARQTRQELAAAPDRYQALQRAEAAVKPLDDAVADLASQLAEEEERHRSLTEQMAGAQAALADLAGDDTALTAVEDATQLLREEVAQAERRVGAARQQVAVLDALREQQTERLAQRDALTTRIQRYEALQKAAGRDGVQALLIEEATPELEASANDLLSRLTGGRMAVRFDTQRQMKSREGMRETLDIHIRDDAGERPYENFSGGEQFRVNFAIRLALSRILARRAGAQLQTLVVDEGFGSQDPEGRQRLVEAINAIQDDFQRILIITHIDELRDAFPNRIEVEKTPTGSKIALY